MTITYSPYYDQNTYERAGSAVTFGHKVTGTHGVLAELELRAGLTHPEVSSTDRMLAYYHAIKRAVRSGHPFYKESFEKDELSVTSELLRWRDALIMTGWNAKLTDQSKPVAYKFNDIAAIEPYFNCPGTADRWMELLGESGYMAGSTIDVLVEKDCLDKVITDVLDRCGATVNYPAKGAGAKLDIKAEVKVIPFRNRVYAYRWAAGQEFGADTLVVNADNKALNDVLRAHDLPLVSADYTDSNPLTIQLFKLGFGLFDSKVDIKTLVSYLQAPYSPVESELRRKLLYHLLRTGGYGEKWDAILEEAETSHEELSQVTSGEMGDVMAYAQNLAEWADGYARMLWNEERDLDVAEQMSALYDMTMVMISLLESSRKDGETLTVERLRKWIDGIYNACSFSAERAQVGSYELISDAKAIVDGPEKLVWLDCNAGGRARYPLYFLSNAELEWLKGCGVHIVDEEDFSRSANIALKQALGKVEKEIVLCTSQIAYGSRCDEHPVLTEIKATETPYSVIENPEMPEGVEWDVLKLAADSAEIELSKGVDVPEREHGESYSSIDTLIQHPVDYVLDYVLGMREQDMGQIADIAIIKGNVAHAVIGHCAMMLKANPELKLGKEEISKIIDDYAKQNGQLLYNDNMQYGSFKLKLVQSVGTLLALIKENNLKVVGEEVPVETVLPEVGPGKGIGKFNARIDLLLEDANGDFVVIDMKWSESRRYKNKVWCQTDLQLVLYAEALKAAYPGKKVLGCAYYVIPQYKIVTNNPYFKGWDERHLDYADIPFEDRVSTYLACVNSYCFRKEQLKNGLLENGELFVIDEVNFEYFKAIVEDGMLLYPIEGDWQDENSKAAAYGNKNFILKGRAI